MFTLKNVFYEEEKKAPAARAMANKIIKGITKRFLH